jgi:hypothetical protein
MKLNKRLAASLMGATTLLLVVACGEAAAPPPTAAPQSQSLAPTPVSPEVRQTAMEFARSQQAIEQDWDRFHRDFDEWRSGLIPCHRSSAERALREFSGDFNSVLEQARGLPRSAGVRSLADQMVRAAEEQDEALRRLRDGWQPSDTALFAEVEAKRTASASAQQEVLDQLSDMREGADPRPVEEARGFSTAFEGVSSSWTDFHSSFNTLRGQQANLSAGEVSNRLSELVDRFEGIVSSVESLPASSSTRDMKESLQAAAQAEDRALKQLRDDLKARAEATETGSGAANSADAFAGLNDLMTRSNNAQERIRNDLREVLDNTAARQVGDIDTFRQRFDGLVRTWSEFNRDYDHWRRTEGGCNRTEVVEQLNQFSLRFGEIAGRVRNLPPAPYIRPMEDTLVEAVQREEEALRVLRNTWRPFATDAFRAVDQERTNSNRLRRQAQVGTQEMLDRFGIAPGQS